MSMQIDISSVSVQYETSAGPLLALKNIHLGIARGEFVCLLGESGCGKSTLLRLVAGLQQPSSGIVKVGDQVVSGPDPKLGVVFQSPALLPWLTVKENVALGFRIRSETVPHDLIQRTLDMVALTGFERARPKNLSGGMAQRAAIARALVSNPDVLLMDEPFGALDALTRLRMQTELRRIWSEQKVTIIFVTHDIDEAIVLGSRIVVMTPRPGRIARIINIPLKYPRSKRSADFLRLKVLISDELMEADIRSEAKGSSKSN